MPGALAFGFVVIWNAVAMALMPTTGSAKTLPIVASEMSELGMNVPDAAVFLLSLSPLPRRGLPPGLVNAMFANQSRQDKI